MRFSKWLRNTKNSLKIELNDLSITSGYDVGYVKGQLLLIKHITELGIDGEIKGGDGK